MTTTDTSHSPARGLARPWKRVLRWSQIADPRVFQIVALSTLVLWARFALGVDLGADRLVVAIGTALGVQALGCRLVGTPFEARSALISALSLCLLARTASLGFLAATAVVAIGSKFTLRARGRHIFNPTNFGIVVMWLATDGVWISPGQWGRGAVLAAFCVLAGALVVHRALRADVTLSFLASYAGLLLVRGAWLGDPLPVSLHSLQSGALLIFAFFMISDPKTTPSGARSRLAYGALVAFVAVILQFGFYEPNGPILALVLTAPLVPLIDLAAARSGALRGRFARGWAFRALFRRDPLESDKETSMHIQPSSPPVARPMPTHHARRSGDAPASPHRLSPPRALLAALGVSLLAVIALAAPGRAFCGFYVAKADTKLFNKASQVVLVRDGDRTVVTMASDYRGDMKEFAMVIPVPTFLEREQIHVAEQSLIDHLDAYTAPRLVEYFDENPCMRYRAMKSRVMESAAPMPASDQRADLDAEELGVTIEAKYTVGEYDILLLDARESEGLLTFLQRSGYRLPRGAEPVLASYLRQGMRFFVAKVNLDEQQELGFANLRPIQVAYESPKFMLPIRLGTVNADGAQELFVYTLTRRGRVETTNYRTVKLPTDVDVPTFVKADFGDFYRDMFQTQVRRDGMQSVFLEYAWDMNWCDPCAADPLSPQQLRELGVFWQTTGSGKSQARDVFVTRLHVRYDREHFPQDLRFQQTDDRSNFQGRYVMRHAWQGGETCEAAKEYYAGLEKRFEREAQNLARLTGWDIRDIRERMDRPVEGPARKEKKEGEAWWRKLWPGR